MDPYQQMQIQTIWLIVGTFLCYTLVTVVIPALVFSPVFKDLTYPLRMMGYYCIGNTIIILLVFALEFMKISYRPTLILGTAFVYVYFFLHIRGSSYRANFRAFYNTVNQISNGVLTVKTIWGHGLKKRRAFRKNVLKGFVRYFLAHILEWAAIAGVIFAATAVIGIENIHNFGYHASDIPVHTYWTNNLVGNKPFIAGVYPFGMHIMIYYLHMLFGFKIMNLYRIYGLINLIFVSLNVSAMLMSIFRNKFLPFMFAFLYFAFSVVSMNNVGRFLSGLPQEYATVFIFPSVAFAIAFFKYRHQNRETVKLDPSAEPKEKKGIKSLFSKKKDKIEKPLKEKPVKANKIKKEKSQVRGDHYLSVKDKRQRREFDRIAKQIKAEKEKQTKKNKTVPVKTEKKDVFASAIVEVEPTEIVDETPLITVDDIMAGSEKNTDTSAEIEIAVEAVEENTETAEVATEENVQVAQKKETVTFTTGSELESLDVLTVDPAFKTTTISAEDDDSIRSDEYEAVHISKKKLHVRIKEALSNYVAKQKFNLTSREDVQCMFLFSLAFGLTMEVHFFATIWAVFFYFAIAFAYIVRFIRPKYFVTILKSIALGIIITILPFSIAIAMGTRLEGSLYWAMSFLTSSTETVEETEEYIEEDEEQTVIEDEGAGSSEDVEFAEDSDVGADIISDEEVSVPRQTVFDKIKEKFSSVSEKFKSKGDNIQAAFDVWFFQYTGNVIDGKRFPMDVLFKILVVVAVLESIILVIPYPDYAKDLIAVLIAMIFETLAYLGSYAGLPGIMEISRGAFFVSILMVILFLFEVDALITILLGWLKWKFVKWIPHAVSLAVCAAIVFVSVENGAIRAEDEFYGFDRPQQLNGAIITTNRILNENRDHTYTILSPVDELRMTDMYGYHYEEIILLHKLENVGSVQYGSRFDIHKLDTEDINDPNVFIPTKYVYIYVEKKPLGFLSVDYKSDLDRLAKEPVPFGVSSAAYSDVASRSIVMAKMAKWVKALKKIYPESITTYYEDDEFVCYRLMQGGIPFNLGIDYGYNKVT